MAKSNTASKTKPTKPGKKQVVKKKPNKKGAGRPTKLDASTVTKLLSGFNNHMNDTKACEYAGISRDAFYRWMKKDKVFYDKIMRAKSFPYNRAREVIVDGLIAGDIGAAKYFLDRRDPDFKPSKKLEHEFSDIPVVRVEFVNGKKRKSNRKNANTR